MDLFSIENDDTMLHNKLFGDELSTNTGLLEDDAAIIEKIKTRKMKMIAPEKQATNVNKDIEKYKVSFTASIRKLDAYTNDTMYKCDELKQMVMGNTKHKKQVGELYEHVSSIKQLINEFRSHYNTSTTLLTSTN